MAEPLISVVMPVRNVAPFVGASIQSILEQTLSDFELVILDDGSTDETAEVVGAWAEKDNRIRFFQSKENLGLRSSSNAVVSHSRADIIARMDGDDISLPDRLRRQWELLKSDDDAVLVGTLSVGMDAEGRLVRPRDRWRLVRRSNFAPFPHGSIMYRRQAFDEIGGYGHFGGLGEDQDLFLRLAQKGKVLVIPDVLYRYRYHVNSASLTTPATDVDSVSGIQQRQNSGVSSADADRTNAKRNLEALYTIGALRLWAGYPPAVLKHMLTRQALRLDRESLRILIWATWAEFNPATLRLSLRSLIRARDLLASLMVKNGRPCEWRFEQS